MRKRDGCLNGHNFAISVAAYSIWNIWKERNRRIFKNEMLATEGVVVLINHDLDHMREAFWE